MTPNTQWSLSVFCSLPPVHLTLLPAQFHSRLRDLPFSTPLCRTSNDHSTPRGALKFPPPHLSSRLLSRGSPRTGTHDICLSERGRRSRTPLPVCQRIILACHAIQHLLFSTGRAKDRKNKSGENERVRERSAENIFMDFRCFIVCARLPHRYM